MMSIPVVDFGKCNVHCDKPNNNDMQELGDQICDAFIKTGFVYLLNTGIASSEVDRLNAVTGEFFTQPEEVKAKYHRRENNFGHDCLGKEKLADGIPGDFKESFNITGSAVIDSNIKWPDDVVPDFSTTVKSFMKQCKHLALRILHAVSFGLNLNDSEKLSHLHSSILERNNQTSLRCLYYPPVSSHQEGQVRLAEHTDYGSLTLLFQDSVGGLQIKTRDGGYADAVPIHGSVLVNVADLLQYWTKGKLKSTPHRILMPDKEEQRKSVRRSVAFFVHPSMDLLVSRNILDENNADGFMEKPTKLFKQYSAEEIKTLTVGDYVLHQFKTSYEKK